MYLSIVSLLLLLGCAAKCRFVTVESRFDRLAKGALESNLPDTGNRCRYGWVAEWTKAAVLKTAVRVTVPGVRIPPHPLNQGRRKQQLQFLNYGLSIRVSQSHPVARTYRTKA